MIDAIIALYGGLGGIVFGGFLYACREIRGYHWELDCRPVSPTDTIKYSWDYCPQDPTLTYNANNFATKQNNQWHCYIPKHNVGSSVYLYTDYYIPGDRYFRFALRDVKNAEVHIITKFYGGTKDKWIESEYIPEMKFKVDTTNKLHCFDGFKSQISTQDVRKEQLGLHVTCINENEDCRCVISEAYIGRKKNMVNLCGYRILFYKKT